LCRNAKADIAWLVSQLVDVGSNVVCLVRDWVRGDITDRDLLERALGEGDGSR
jgi:uncharacterized protein YbjT (DUF2867 family)